MFAPYNWVLGCLCLASNKLATPYTLFSSSVVYNEYNNTAITSIHILLSLDAYIDLARLIASAKPAKQSSLILLHSLNPFLSAYFLV